jgi:hypothetical protein
MMNLFATEVGKNNSLNDESPEMNATILRKKPWFRQEETKNEQKSCKLTVWFYATGHSLVA